MRISIFGAALMAAAISWPPATTAAQPKPAEPVTFGDTVDVQLVNVEVWVTDRHGNPVSGLEVDDFEVREDGETVAVSNFAEIRNPPLPPSLEPTDPLAAPVDRPLATQTLALETLLREDLPREDPRHGPQAGFLALYVDELFSGAAGRQQLVIDLRAFFELQRVPPGRVLILRQDEGLRVEANFGSTRAELEAALARLAKPSHRGAQTWADEKNAFRRLQDIWEREAVHRRLRPGQDPCDFFIDPARREVQFHVELSRTRIEETLGYLADTASFLAGLPGPKTLVYVSDGLPTTPGTDLMGFVKNLCPGREVDRRRDYHHGLGEAFRRFGRHANANRVTVHTLQASGLRHQGSAKTADQRGVLRTIRATDRYTSESRVLQRQGLFLLAEETGGRAVVNRGRLIEELEQIAADMAGYYSLAYAPPHGGDGLEHEIEVRVREIPGSGAELRLRHRPGYRDKSLDQRLFERLESTLYLNLMVNPLEVSLGAGRVIRGENLTSTVPLHVQVPVDRITFLPRLGGEQASFRVVAMARDERNRRTAFKQEVYHLPRPSGTDPEQQISLVFELELEAGVHVVAFGVRDEATKQASFVATSLEVLEPAGASGSGI